MGTKFDAFLRARNVKVTVQEAEGLRSRLIFAGLNPDTIEAHNSIAEDILDKMIDKMRASKKEMHEYAEKTSTVPKCDTVKIMNPTPSEQALMVNLVNGRVAMFNAKNNVVMPLKVTPPSK